MSAPKAPLPHTASPDGGTDCARPDGGLVSLFFGVLTAFFRGVALERQRFWRIIARLFRDMLPLRTLSRISLKFNRALSKVRQSLLQRVYTRARNAASLLRAFREAGSFPAGLRALLSSLRGRRLLQRTVNYLLPAGALAGLCFLISFVTNLNFAVGVEYNGQLLGYVENETVYTEAKTALYSRIIRGQDDDTLYVTPAFRLAVVDGAELKTAPQLTDTLLRSSASDIVQATGITVDGDFLGAVRDGGLLRQALDDILASHRDGRDKRVEFTKEVTLESGLFLQQNLRNENEILSILNADVEQNVYYTAVPGDTPSGIAALYDMSTAELAELNPGILTDLKVGRQVLVKKAAAFLPVREIREETSEAPIPYDTVYVDSSTLYEGMTSTLSAGRNGLKSVTAEVSYVDGVEVSRTVLSESVLEEPVSARIARGTMKMQVASGYENAKKSGKGLIWPVSGGYISQYYGHTPYEYWHNGIDYAFGGGGYGKPIVSSLPGTVTYAGWRGSYGNLVVVNHGNGIETWYAHCASVLVRVGDTVAQGQQIAKVGSTGNSSGNHLHFRVVVNGTEKNPLDYLP